MVVGVIALFALVGCSSSDRGSDPSSGSGGGGGSELIDTSPVDSMTDCDELQGMIDSSEGAAQAAGDGVYADRAQALADAAEHRMKELNC